MFIVGTRVVLIDVDACAIVCAECLGSMGGSKRLLLLTCDVPAARLAISLIEIAPKRHKQNTTSFPIL